MTNSTPNCCQPLADQAPMYEKPLSDVRAPQPPVRKPLNQVSKVNHRILARVPKARQPRYL